VHLCASEYGGIIYIYHRSASCDLAVKAAKPATCSYGDNGDNWWFDVQGFTFVFALYLFKQWINWLFDEVALMM
jgi:hypothetical protein